MHSDKTPNLNQDDVFLVMSVAQGLFGALIENSKSLWDFVDNDIVTIPVRIDEQGSLIIMHEGVAYRVADLLPISIETYIESHSPFSGTKSIHQFHLDVNTGEIFGNNYATGSTHFFGFEVEASGRTSIPVPAVVHRPNGSFDVMVSGETATGLEVFPSIDYEFKINLNSETGQFSLSGKHDAYPSYRIKLGKEKEVVYDFHHQKLNPAEAWLELFGDKDDVEVKHDGHLYQDTSSSPGGVSGGGHEGGTGGAGGGFPGGGLRGGGGGGPCRETLWDGQTLTCIRQ